MKTLESARRGIAKHLSKNRAVTKTETPIAATTLRFPGTCSPYDRYAVLAYRALLLHAWAILERAYAGHFTILAIAATYHHAFRKTAFGEAEIIYLCSYRRILTLPQGKIIEVN